MLVPLRALKLPVNYCFVYIVVLLILEHVLMNSVHYRVFFFEKSVFGDRRLMNLLALNGLLSSV